MTRFHLSTLHFKAHQQVPTYRSLLCSHPRFWLFSFSVCCSYSTVTARFLRCLQLIFMLAADKRLLLHPWEQFVYLHHFGWSLVQSKRHPNGSVTSAGPPHYPKVPSLVSHEEAKAAGMKREQKGKVLPARWDQRRGELLWLFLGAREGEEHTLDFIYKHHRWISKLPGKKP